MAQRTVAAALVLAVCSACGHRTAATPPTALAKSLVVHAGEMPPFEADGTVRVYPTPKAVATGMEAKGRAAAREAATLEGEGFLVAAAQRVHHAGAIGISTAEVFASQSGARREFARLVPVALALQAHAKVERFRLVGIPGAVAFVGKDVGSRAGVVNVFFSTGRCVLVVGDASRTRILRRPVVVAARTIFRRAEGACSA